MNQKQRIEALERRVKELEARPPMVVYPPYYVPYSQPTPQWWQQPQWRITYGSSTTGDGTYKADSPFSPTCWYDAEGTKVS